jgi:exopolysaccharide production protein ExoZ
MRGWRHWQRVSFFIALAVISFAILLRMPGPYLRLVMFLSGILLYEAIGSSIRRWSHRIPGESVALLAFLASFPLIFVIWIRPNLVSFLPGIHTLGGGYCVLVLFGSFLGFAFFCFGQDGLLNQLFSWTPLRWLGNMSYSYYISHGFTLKVMARVAARAFPSTGNSPVIFWSVLPFAIAATLVFSTLLFITVEKPFSLRTEGLRRTST